MTGIGLIGCGNWGKFILRDLKTLGANVSVVARTDTSRKNARDYGADEIVSSLDELPFTLDAYVVATTTVNHYSVTKQLLERGKPIFVEKPLCPSLSQVQELSQLGNGLIYVMHKWRYHEGINTIKEIYDSKEFGKLISIHIHRNQFGMPHIDVDSSWILLPHDLSIVFHILGYIPEIRWASAVHNEGWVNSLNCHLGPEPDCYLELSDSFYYKERSLNLNFEKAVIQTTDALSDKLQMAEKLSGRKKDISFKPNMPLYQELSSFIRHIQTAEPLLSPICDELLIVEAVENIRKLALA